MKRNGYVFTHEDTRYVVTGTAVNGLDRQMLYLCQELKEGGQLVVWPEVVVNGGVAENLTRQSIPFTSVPESVLIPEASLEETSSLMRFLEVDSCQEKLDILQHMRNHVTVSELDAMSISLDLDNESGSLEEKYYGLERFLKMRIRFEGRR